MTTRALLLLLCGVSQGSGEVVKIFGDTELATHTIYTEADPLVQAAKKDNKGEFVCPPPPANSTRHTCECRQEDECNAGPETKTLVCRNAGDCNCGDVDLCICQNVGFCACENAKHCFCSSIGDCAFKPGHPAHLWECPIDPFKNPPKELPMTCTDRGCKSDIPVFRHEDGNNACNALGCDYAWECSGGECGLRKEDGWGCNEREREHMYAHVTMDGKNPCAHCPGSPPWRGPKRCNNECFAAESTFGSNPAASLQMNWALYAAMALMPLLVSNL